MAATWSLQTKYSLWQRVSLAILQAKQQCNMIPAGTFEAISGSIGFTVERITELDEGPTGFHHDLHAFVETCKETMRRQGVPEAVIAHLHKDVTSYDVEDSAFSLQVLEATDQIIASLRELRSALYDRACEFKLVPMVGITHGQAAEIITLGLKLLNYVDIVDRDLERLTILREDMRVGRLAGAVGNYGHLRPEMEKRVCKILGLKPARISTQILHRDRHADLFHSCVLVACNLEHIDHNLWLMCQFPRMEAREPFKAGQRGSSQMPHKRNPHKIERIRGLAAQVRGYEGPIKEMVMTFDERAIDQSSVERISWVDGTTLVHYMINQLTQIMRGMVFFPERLQHNIDLTLGLLSSGYVKDLLLPRATTLLYKGELQPVYTFVQSCAFEAWERQVHLQVVLYEQGVLGVASKDEIEACFDPQQSLQYVEAKFEEFAPLAA